MARKLTEAEILNAIRNYGYKPMPKFRGVAPAFLGIEVECWNEKNKIANNVAAAKVNRVEDGLFYCKTDGSIYKGFEAVSHPCTYDVWRSMYKNIAKMLTTLRREGFRAAKCFHDNGRQTNSSAGVHIHLSRNAFTSTEHLFKFLRMFYTFKAFTFKMSQRKQEHIDRYAKLTHSNTLENIARYGRHLDSDRYQAVNLQNTNTVEVRIYRGCLDAKTLFKNLAHVQSLLEFTAETTVENCRPRKYRNWVRERRERFPELSEFFDKHFWRQDGIADTSHLVDGNE